MDGKSLDTQTGAILCSEAPLFRRSFVPNFYKNIRNLGPPEQRCLLVTSKDLCSEDSVFRRAYVPIVKRQFQVEIIIQMCHRSSFILNAVKKIPWHKATC